VTRWAAACLTALCSASWAIRRTAASRVGADLRPLRRIDVELDLDVVDATQHLDFL